MTHPLENSLSIAQLVPATEAEGPGRRFAIWFQGCPLRCAECCNPEMLSFSGGQTISRDQLLSQIDASANDDHIEGITLLGGEPFAHAVAAAPLARAVQDRGLSVMVFSGYTFDYIRQSKQPEFASLIRHTDILVDGPYLRDQPESQRRWIGSANQQIHFLSDRYQADDPRWLLPNTLEIRFAAGSIDVNGFPSKQATSFWKRDTQARVKQLPNR